MNKTDNYLDKHREPGIMNDIILHIFQNSYDQHIGTFNDSQLEG